MQGSNVTTPIPPTLGEKKIILIKGAMRWHNSGEFLFWKHFCLISGVAPPPESRNLCVVLGLGSPKELKIHEFSYLDSTLLVNLPRIRAIA